MFTDNPEVMELLCSHVEEGGGREHDCPDPACAVRQAAVRNVPQLSLSLGQLLVPTPTVKQLRVGTSELYP